jgi:hypothetical protein
MMVSCVLAVWIMLFVSRVMMAESELQVDMVTKSENQYVMKAPLPHVRFSLQRR